MAENFWNEHVKAILVGVSDYSAFERTPDLPLSVRDVDLMGKALVQGLQVNPFHIWAKSSEPGFVTRESFLDGIRLFLQDILPEDILIFYFSGHGTVVRGMHYLVFSDGPLETQSVIDLFSEMKADKRVLLLDACMSGQYELSDAKKLNAFDGKAAKNSEGTKPDDETGDKNSSDGSGKNAAENTDTVGEPDYDWIEGLLSGGTAVFASSRPEERAGYNTELPASLFTMFLWNAMTNRFYLRRGLLTLDRIRELVYKDADAWNERHPDRAQHPVFRSSMFGTLSFQVAEFKPYVQKQFSLEREDYIVAEVKPLHSQIAKRYAMKVILKHAVTEAELVLINSEIVQAVRYLDIYKSEREERRWKGRPANLVFIYYGHSEEDLAQGIIEFHTTWADETEDRAHWYRLNSHRKVIDETLVDANPSYSWLRKLTENNSADQATVFAETKEIVGRLIDRGEEVARIYQEYRNGMLSSNEVLRELRGTCLEIDRDYIAAADLPVPPLALTKWSLLASDVAGDILDFSCILFERNKTAIFPEMIDTVRMDDAVSRFHRDLERLRKEEIHLKEER